jgi:hypothetical protein
VADPKTGLLAWATDVLKPAADLAWVGKGEFSCGDWCRFCKAKSICRARAEENLKLAQHDFRLPPELSDAEIEVILSKVDGLVSWASDVKEYALRQALSGKEWHGFKLVEGRSVRRYTDETSVAKAVTDAGYDPYERKLLGITAMQKLLGKSRFDGLLSAYIERPQGKPTLVPDSDKRPAMNTAKNDFKEKNTMSKRIANPMKVITGPNTRWSYANVWEPKSINGGTPKYSVSLIIPKSDTATLTKIKAAIEAAYKEARPSCAGTERACPPCRRSRRPCATAMWSVRTTMPTGTLTSSMRTPPPLRASWMLT